MKLDNKVKIDQIDKNDKWHNEKREMLEHDTLPSLKKQKIFFSSNFLQESMKKDHPFRIPDSRLNHYIANFGVSKKTWKASPAPLFLVI